MSRVEGQRIRTSSLVGSDRFEFSSLRHRQDRGSSPEFLLSDVEGRPRDEQIVGGMMILWWENEEKNERYMFIQREKNTSLTWDKEKGDYSIVAGARKEKETIEAMMCRKVYEEAGLALREMDVCNIPVAFLDYPKSKGKFVVVMDAQLKNNNHQRVEEGSPLGLTDNFGWIKVESFLNSDLQTRGAVKEVVRWWHERRRNIMAGIISKRDWLSELFIKAGEPVKEVRELELIKL